MEAPVELLTECPWCGEISVTTADLRCRVERASERGLCEFHCPICSRLVILPATASSARALLERGATSITGLAPFEFIEPHGGPPISWDDVLDLHLVLEHTDHSQEEIAA